MQTAVGQSRSREGRLSEGPQDSDVHLFCAGCGELSENRPGPAPTPAECREMAGFLQGFVNPVRVEILCALRDGEKSVGEIARRLRAKQSNISRQLQVLMAKGYVARRREERNIYYRVPKTQIYEVMEHIFRLVCPNGFTGGD